MTNGDYALFTISDLATLTTLTPWISYNLTDDNASYRMQSFRAIKQVRDVNQLTDVMRHVHAYFHVSHCCVVRHSDKTLSLNAHVKQKLSIKFYRFCV